MMMMAVAATMEAQDNNKTPQERREAFKERTVVVADSIRAKLPRAARRVAESAAVVAEKTPVFVDSAAVQTERLGRKAVMMGDTIVERSKKAWKAMKGE